MKFGAYESKERGTRVIPRSPSRDLARTKRFVEALGFSAILVGDGADYLIARNGWVELHWFADPQMDPATTAQSFYIRVADAGAVFASAPNPFAGEEKARLCPPVDREWGMRETYLFDPDNNLIIIGSIIDPLNFPKPGDA